MSRPPGVAELVLRMVLVGVDRDAGCRTEGARQGWLPVPRRIGEPEPTLDHLGRVGEASLPRKNVPGPAAPLATVSRFGGSADATWS